MRIQANLAVLLTIALLAAGCLGATQEQDIVSNPGGDLASDPGPRTIEHALGETLIEGVPERVVVLEWPYVEALLAMGIQPVGIADVSGFKDLVDTGVELDASVVDVGTRQEPNLEKVAELEPDLIIGVEFRHAQIHDTLASIADTLIFNPWPENGDQLTRMEDTVRAIGSALAAGDEADAALHQLHTAMEAGKARLEAAGVAGDPFVLSQVLAPEWGDFRLFQEHHAAVQIIEGLGLTNAWEGEYEANGFSTVSLEALATVEEAHFLYVPSSGASLDRYDGNPAWEDLQFVEEDRLFDLSGAWLLPGPLSAEAFIDLVVDAMAPATEETRTIEHSAGETEITGTPERVVALEWTYAEDLLALGIQPVGVADVEGYRAWVKTDVALSSRVQDVGTRQEPNLETLAELEPDLIVGVEFRHSKIYEDLSSIAPTLLFNPYPAEAEDLDQYTEMEQTFRTIAEAMDRSTIGDRVLDELHARFEEAAQTLAETNQSDREILLAQSFTYQDSPTLRVFSHNALASQIAERIGFQNAWTEEYETYGFSTVGLEALAPVEHADFHYVAQPDDNPFENQWKENPVWNDLQFVEEDRVYPLGGDTWLFGGPLSADVFVDKLLQPYLE